MKSCSAISDAALFLLNITIVSRRFDGVDDSSFWVQKGSPLEPEHSLKDSLECTVYGQMDTVALS